MAFAQKKNKTPEQLWMGGTLQNANKESSAIRGILLPHLLLRQQLEQALQQYGLTTEELGNDGEINTVDEHGSARERVEHLLLQNLRL